MRLALAALVLAACGHPAATPAPPPAHAPADASPVTRAAADAGPPDARPLTDDLPALAARSVAMLEQVADALAGGGDCAALAAKVAAAMDANREVRLAAAAVSDRGDAHPLAEALGVYHDRVIAAAARMQPAIDRCGKDAAFAAALTPLDTP